MRAACWARPKSRTDPRQTANQSIVIPAARAESRHMRPARTASRSQPPPANTSRGVRILLTSLTIGAVGVTPLLLYILLGPEDGNPIGLGLLAVLAMAVGGIGSLIGAGIAVLEFLTRPRR